LFPIGLSQEIFGPVVIATDQGMFAQLHQLYTENKVIRDYRALCHQVHPSDSSDINIQSRVDGLCIASLTTTKMSSSRVPELLRAQGLEPLSIQHYKMSFPDPMNPRSGPRVDVELGFPEEWEIENTKLHYCSFV
jgi:hypothetical protein